MRKVLVAAAVAWGLVACSGAELGDDTDDNRYEGIDDLDPGEVGGSDGVGGAGGSESMLCQPGSTTSCYTGPPATQGVGVCVPGSQVCAADGQSWGPCDGEVTPTQEVCSTEGDDDCDGMTNEDGPDCACTPGSVIDCYSGPPSTKNVGICQAGTQTCNTDGDGYGPCLGDARPQAEDCNTAADEDCDGATPPCPEATVDLRVDNNRNGQIDLTDPTEDSNEHLFTASSGAVFLANIDDDQNACPTSGSDSALANCDDTTDTYVNGNDDLLDLARIKTVPWPDAPSDASGYITVSSPGSNYVRLFKKSGSNWSVYTPGSNLSSSEIQAGVELGIEGLDIIRDDTVWSGVVDLTLHLDGGTGPNGPLSGGTDTVRMRMSPMMFRHHLEPVTTYYVTYFNSTASAAFRNDLATASSATGASVHNIYESDQWTQDFFETAYMAMPAAGGQQHVIDVNVRSANYTGQLRTAGRVVYTDLRGKDVAGITHYDPSHSNEMDTLNSFGNLETIPPYSYNGQSWPLGRVLRGSHSSFYPDTDFDHMVQSQGVQDIVEVDTSWLLVAHVDETLSFIKANTARGWVALVNDAPLAKTMLQQQQAAGWGWKEMFVGKYWSGSVPAAVSIDEVLADTDVMNDSAWAAVKVDEQINDLKAATGLTNGELVSIPFLHWESSGWSVAYQPGTVNGIYLSDSVFAAPDPHGPVINGADIFKTQMTDALQPFGVNVSWIEDWDLYHRLLGEVHCGTNATRQVVSKWWESGL